MLILGKCRHFGCSQLNTPPEFGTKEGASITKICEGPLD